MEERTAKLEVAREVVLEIYSKHRLALHAVVGVTFERHIYVSARIQQTLVDDGNGSTAIVNGIVNAFRKCHTVGGNNYRTFGHIISAERNFARLRSAVLTGKDELILFGKAGHPEVAGVAGHSAAGKLIIISSADDVDSLPELAHPVFISQTTVDHGEVNAALEKLKLRFPQLEECSNVCDASWKRQNAVLELAKKCDAVLIIGSAHSSNARRLMEIARRTGVAAFLIDDASQITSEMLSFDRIGISSGASTPQYLFDGVVAALETAGFSDAKKEADL